MKRTTPRSLRPTLATLGIILAAWSSVARAQEPAQPPPTVEGAPPVEEAPVAPPPPAVDVEQPEPPPPPPPVRRVPPRREVVADVDDSSDLDVERRRVGVGYAGISQIPIGAPAQNLTAPAIGVRIWLNRTTGVDLALGLGWTDGSSKSGNVETNFNAVWGFILQGGVPIALSTHKHVSFQIIPYTAIAHGETTLAGGGFNNPSTTLSGTRFDLGVRTGLEIFWGFIGLPQLSLSATVGAAFELRKVSSENRVFSESTTTYGFSTTVQSTPWDIFTGNVAARYYF